MAGIEKELSIKLGYISKQNIIRIDPFENKVDAALSSKYVGKKLNYATQRETYPLTKYHFT